MSLHFPNHWTRTLEPDGIVHPFNDIAWRLADLPSEIPDDVEYSVQSIIDALHRLEDEHIYRQNLRRTTRKFRISQGRPVLTDDTALETAFHTAMLNMQLETDQMSYDRFKVIYDEVLRQLKPVEADDIDEDQGIEEGQIQEERESEDVPQKAKAVERKGKGSQVKEGKRKSTKV